jgi:hypothetical protein
MEEKNNMSEKQAGMPPVPLGLVRPSFPPPPPASFAAQPANRDAAAEESARMKEEKDKLEKKISEMEKLVSQEKEKALLATLKNQQDEALSSKVEASLKDIQDKLRRDRHEQEVQEERLTLKAKIKDLESRLVSDRETWMQTLKAQMQERETQSKDVEGHFIYRLQEMERRWLDEKAQWQKSISQKEDEVRTFRRGAEKQEELEDELRRSAMDKEMQARDMAKLRDEISKLERDKASVESYIKHMPEREREFSDLKVENAVLRAREEKARDEVKLAEERFRRDSDALQKEIGRLQSDIGTVSDRKNSEKDEEIKKLQARHQAEQQDKEKTIADVSGEKIRAISELLKMKGLLSRVQAINAVLEKERQSLRLEKMQMAQAMAANIEDVRKYRSEAEVLKAAHQAEFQKFKNDYAANAGAEYSGQITELESRRQADLMAAVKKHQEELAKVRAGASMDLERKILEMRAQYEASANEIRAGVKKGLELEYTAEIARLRAVASQAEDDKARLKSEAKISTEEAGGVSARLAGLQKEYSEQLARAQKEFDDSKIAMTENYKKQDAQIKALMEIKADNERSLAAALAAKSSRERELAGMGQVLNSSNEKAAGLEAELAAVRSSNKKAAGLEAELTAIRQKAAELEQKLQGLSGQLETERLNSAAVHDASARQSQSDQERIASISAELKTYKQIENSFPERMKWALKGRKE